MLRHAKRVISAIEGNELRLEEDVAPDLKRRRGRLDTTKASW
jgi:hypothetical protein